MKLFINTRISLSIISSKIISQIVSSCVFSESMSIADNHNPDVFGILPFNFYEIVNDSFCTTNTSNNSNCQCHLRAAC